MEHTPSKDRPLVPCKERRRDGMLAAFSACRASSSTSNDLCREHSSVASGQTKGRDAGVQPAPGSPCCSVQAACFVLHAFARRISIRQPWTR